MVDRRPEWLLCIWDRILRHQRPIRAIRCFFTGHKVHYGEYWLSEPAWCSKCWYNEDELNIEEGWTMPRLLNHVYRWLVNRNWRWFDKFDDWACCNAKWLPGWWEY